MFEIVWQPRVVDLNGRTGEVFYKATDALSARRICNVTTWGMNSCAVATLQKWGSYCVVNDDDVESFFNWLNDNVDGDWSPREFYFLLSTRQLKQFKELIHFPNVRLRDKFKNKSHGPNNMYLYRYSACDDFKRVITARKDKV